MKTSLALLGCLIGLAGCTTTPAGAPEMREGADVRALAPFEGLTPEMAGVWRSNGYGYLADLSGDLPRFFHLTADICLPFEEEDSSPFDTVDSVGVSADGKRLLIGASVEPHVYEFDRVAAVPERCLAPVQGGRMTVFDAFASYMAEHYAFFDLYGVDWDASVAEARSRVREDMSDKELFDLLAGLLAPIEDGHVELIAEIDGERRRFDPGEAASYEAVMRTAEAKGMTPVEAKRAFNREVWLEGVDTLFVEGSGAEAGNGWIRYGLVAPDIGYFATYTSAGFAQRDFSDPLGDVEVLEAALDDALALFEAAGVTAVILDASMNHGGHDFISRAMASRFAAQRVYAYSKRANDAAEPYLTRVYVEPSEGRRFTGRVYLLTSDITVSAAEILTLSMRALPNVVHVGGTTRGAFSDILEKPLPNGWTLTLSNEVYADSEGQVWEEKGVVPTAPLQVFSADDPAGCHAKAVRAVAALAKGAAVSELDVCE